MNSVEAYKGFITFLILGSIVGLSVLGFNLINKSSNTESSAKEDFSEPKNVEVKFEGSNQAIIIWKTDQPTITEIQYSLNSDLSNSNRTPLDQTKKNDHFVKIENVQRGRTYYYKIKQGDHEHPLNADPYTFTMPDVYQVAPIIREVNEAQTQEQLLEEAPELPVDEVDNNSQTEQPTDYGGFESPKEFDPNQKVLGSGTYVIGENIAKEFKEAVLYKDMRYDFNGDSEVDTDDYPLFINFILNQED